MIQPPYFPDYHFRNTIRQVSDNKKHIFLFFETIVRIKRDDLYYEIKNNYDHIIDEDGSIAIDAIIKAQKRFFNKCQMSIQLYDVSNLTPAENQIDEDERLKQIILNDPILKALKK